MQQAGEYDPLIAKGNQICHENSVLDLTAFTVSTSWLHLYLPIYGGKPVPITEAFQIGFSASRDQVEKNIERAKREQRQRGGPDPIPHTIPENFRTPFGKSEPEKELYSSLIDWFCKTCPYEPARGPSFSESFSQFMSKKAPIVDQARFLRQFIFKNSATDGDKTFWDNMITQAWNSREDRVKPLEAAKNMENLNTRRKLNLAKYRPEDNPKFEEYIASLVDYKDKVTNYNTLINWILYYPTWLSTKTREQVYKFEMRNSRENPWGEQTHWEGVQRIRRELESWKVRLPKKIVPYEGEITEDKINATLRTNTDHPLYGKPEMIQWYLKVNQKTAEVKKQSAKGGKKRVTPEEALSELPSRAESASFYTRWIKVPSIGKVLTFLEATEIANFGATHFIPADFTVDQYSSYLKALLKELGEREDPIPGFPEVQGFSEALVGAMISASDVRGSDYSPAQLQSLNELRKIQEGQIEKTMKVKWQAHNARMQIAGLNPVTYEEFMHTPEITQEAPRESWATGAMLQKGQWMVAFVENSKAQRYRAIQLQRAKMKAHFGNTASGETTSEIEKEEDRPQTLAKCAQCGGLSPDSKMVTLHMHHEHMPSFYTYASRSRSKVKQQGNIQEPDNVDTLKRKLARLHTTISKLANKSDDEALEVLRSIRGIAKRKAERDPDNDKSEPNSVENTPKRQRRSAGQDGCQFDENKQES